ncbi:MAG: YegP family protein [Ruthenibacterium sp.]
MSKFVIQPVKTGYTFHLKAGNGEVIAISQPYTTEESCKEGIASVQRNAPIAGVEDQTVPDFQKQKHPKFEVYADKKGEHRFRLVATNGQNILASEGYQSKAGCLAGIESVRKNAPAATIQEIAP